jgi:hypothetical protein
MGGIGSGQRWQTAEYPRDSNTKQIDVAFLHRRGCLVDGYSGKLNWTRNGEPNGNISFSVAGDKLALDYRVRIAGGDWHPIVQHVKLERTACNYGGTRAWFLCPHCMSRRGVLYCAHLEFVCRECGNIRYESQQSSALDRAIAKRWKLHEKLFGESKRRMWGKTRAALFEEFIAVETELDRHLEQLMKYL